ncbi:MAG: 2-C-methyl-D-erythritol 2,4-cyclodiphosphate synthase [Rhabdochlamydiaceae bacterium]|nr:2-C-methyl-D-erythritol 2,4-cyclodiphosphate synthase [Rhabdochlamydiaceae bacterium]
MIRTGIGQDSHRFLTDDSTKTCLIGGVSFEDVPGLASDSDGDVVLHAICNAITSLSGVQILGALAQDLHEKEGITDSTVYLKNALDTMHRFCIEHIALSIKAKKPRIENRIEEMRAKIASLLHINIDQVGISATTGSGLSEVGLGEGVECLCIITARVKN